MKNISKGSALNPLVGLDLVKYFVTTYNHLMVHTELSIQVECKRKETATFRLKKNLNFMNN